MDMSLQAVSKESSQYSTIDNKNMVGTETCGL